MSLAIWRLLPFVVGYSAAQRPVILLADVGIDDAAAILWALGAPQLKVLGVVSGFGCHQDVRVTARNAEELLTIANRSDIPVFLGSRWPLGETEVHGDGTIIHGEDGFGIRTQSSKNIDCKATRRESGAEFIVATARSMPRALTLLVFSPLTNLALATMLEPELPMLLLDVVIMGGAVYRHGNASPLAEANFYHDAAAARFVLRTFGAPEATSRLVLAPLDVTHGALLEQSTIDQIGASGHGARRFADAMAVYTAGYCHYAGACDSWPLHDAHAVAWLVDPDMYTEVKELDMDVVVSANVRDATNGYCLVDRRFRTQGSLETDTGRVTVLLQVDAERFKRALYDGISRLE